jgi:hypothetical protein
MNTITFAQLLLAVSIPTVVSLVGILFNQSAIRRVEDKLDTFKDQMYAEFKEFYKTLGQHDAQIETLKEGKH